MYGLELPFAHRVDRDASLCCWGLVSDADLLIREDLCLDLRWALGRSVCGRQVQPDP